MNKLANMNIREKLLILILCLSVLVGGYSLLRIKPLQQEIIMLTESLDDSKKALSETKPIRMNASSTTALRQKLIKLQEKVEKEQALAGLKNSFIDLAKSDAVPTMRGMITALAEKKGLRIRNIDESNVALDTLAGVHTPEGSEVLARPLFDIRFSGEFFQFNQFIEALAHLPNTVIVTKMDIEIANGRYSHSAPLNALLTLAI